MDITSLINARSPVSPSAQVLDDQQPALRSRRTSDASAAPPSSRALAELQLQARSRCASPGPTPSPLSIDFATASSPLMDTSAGEGDLFIQEVMALDYAPRGHSGASSPLAFDRMGLQWELPQWDLDDLNAFLEASPRTEQPVTTRLASAAPATAGVRAVLEAAERLRQPGQWNFPHADQVMGHALGMFARDFNMRFDVLLQPDADGPMFSLSVGNDPCAPYAGRLVVRQDHYGVEIDGRFHDVPSDGDCAFHAVNVLLLHVAGEGLGRYVADRNPDGTLALRIPPDDPLVGNSISVLREMAADDARRHADEIGERIPDSLPLQDLVESDAVQGGSSSRSPGTAADLSTQQKQVTTFKRFTWEVPDKALNGAKTAAGATAADYARERKAALARQMTGNPNATAADYARARKAALARLRTGNPNATAADYEREQRAARARQMTGNPNATAAGYEREKKAALARQMTGNPNATAADYEREQRAARARQITGNPNATAADYEREKKAALARQMTGNPNATAADYAREQKAALARKRTGNPNATAADYEREQKTALARKKTGNPNAAAADYARGRKAARTRQRTGNAVTSTAS
ncbi:hypothetical protein [Paraburkholderia humisilvae]|nr:hypothetical protein [Paraburkholderia humisilvae]